MLGVTEIVDLVVIGEDVIKWINYDIVLYIHICRLMLKQILMLMYVAEAVRVFIKAVVNDVVFVVVQNMDGHTNAVISLIVVNRLMYTGSADGTAKGFINGN